MQVFSITTRVGFVLVACVLVIGCNPKRQRPPDMPALYPCSITITMDGRPLEGASIHCQQPENGKWYGSGVTDSHGMAKMATLSRYPGLAMGEFAVSVVKTIPDPNWVPKPESAPPPVSLVDLRYVDESTSPLKCNIVQGKNEFKFDVESVKTN